VVAACPAGEVAAWPERAGPLRRGRATPVRWVVGATTPSSRADPSAPGWPPRRTAPRRPL